MKIQLPMSIIFILITLNLFAGSARGDWLSHWTAGILSFKNGEYDKAIERYSRAIDVLEETGHLSEHLFLYNSRGQAYLFADLFSESLTDFQTLIGNEKVDLSDRIVAQWGITRCYALLGDVEQFQIALEQVKVLDPDYPKVESNEEYLIFRNFHIDSPCAKKNFVNALVSMNICSQPSDVVFTQTGVCLVKKKISCGVCQRSAIQTNASEAETHCKYWCDRIANGALVVCSNKFKTIKCQWLCVELVEALKSSCHWCCEGEGFYKKCVKPFEDFIPRVPCDPSWED